MERTEFLREQARESTHKVARISMPKEWSVKDLDMSLPERKAYAIAMIMERMPLYIGERELIVGTRAVYGRPGDDTGDQSFFDYIALPSYVNQKDIVFFGFNMEYITQSHYAPDYAILLNKGIQGIIAEAQEGSHNKKIPEVRREFYRSVAIAYRGLSNLILRYFEYALEKSKSAEGTTKSELLRISEVCDHIATDPPQDFYEACQLYWFAYLGCMIENFQFINYGRIDQVLNPWVGTVSKEEAQQLTECLLLKMFDQYDIKLLDRTLMGQYSAQHNITIGGVTRDGENAANEMTRIILTAIGRTRMPEPLISVRISQKSPEWLKLMASQLSVSGLNCINYYNDELYISSLVEAGLPLEDARDYGLGLCQDILIPGRGDHYCSGGIHMTFALLDVLEKHSDVESYEELKRLYKEKIIADIQRNIAHYNRWETAVLKFNDGDPQPFIEGYRKGEFDVFAPAQGLDAAQAARNKESDSDSNKDLYIQSLMSPLPITSALYHGCLETGVDITRCGCSNGDKGFMVLCPVVAVNSLVAIKKVVFEDHFATIREVLDACKRDFQGDEILRQHLWNAPKWGNDDDYVDMEAVEIFECALDEINRHSTPKGGRHLGGLHQPHPVFAGRAIPATPNGRHAGCPIPVTISPENGTVRLGPTAVMRSVTKINPMKVKWNNCVMIQYYASVFHGEDGPEKFVKLMDAYFEMDGMQHQPNVVDINQLKDAQKHPDRYRDLIIRMWGVSAYFVDLPRDVQDEFIARYDGM